MSRIQDDTNKILVDYYEGAYGRTIRIDVQSQVRLLQMKNLFLKLAESVDQIDIADVESVVVTGLDQMNLKRVPSGNEHSKKLVLEDKGTGRVICTWSMHSEGWRRCAGLVDGLLKYNAPGHQYLTHEGVDDAIVEFAFKER
jgi:hypothetical protein